MESLRRSCSEMTQKRIFLVIAILVACCVVKSEGFFLNNFLSETTTEEPNISTTTPSAATLSIDTHQLQFDVIHRNGSENIEESSTQIVNSVKEIVSLVLDKHVTENQKEHQLPDENNQIDMEFRNIALDTNNDIPAPEAPLTNRELDLNDPALSIVKVTEVDNEDIATALKDNFRSPVKDEIIEASAIDVIEDIPEQEEVRQMLTEDVMAMENPQSLKNSEESSSSLAKEEDMVDSTKAPVEVTTNQTITADEVHNADATTITILETETASDVEVTTPTVEVLQEATVFPTKEIIDRHEKGDTGSFLETNPIRMRQMRAYSEDSDTNEILPENHGSLEDKKSSKRKSSDSSDSSSSLTSSGSSLKGPMKQELSTEDENVAAEDTSEEVGEVVSEDASIEESFEKGIVAVKAISTERVSLRVTPTPRPSISTTSKLKPIKANNTNPIVIDSIIESTGEVLTGVAATTGDGRKHTVIKKPGVEEGLFLPKTTAKPTLEKTDAPSDDTISTNQIQSEINTESQLEGRTEASSVVSYVLNTAEDNTDDVPDVTETLITAEIADDVQTENDLLESEDPLVHSESRNSTLNVKSVVLDSVPLENASKALAEVHGNSTEQFSDFNETLTVDTERNLNQTIHDNVTREGDEVFAPLGQNEKENADEPKVSQTPTPQNASNTLLPETDEKELVQSSTLKALIADDQPEALDINEHRPIPVIENDQETSTEAPSINQNEKPYVALGKVEIVTRTSFFSNEISKHLDETTLIQEQEPSLSSVDPEEYLHPNTYESSTERPVARSNEDTTSQTTLKTLMEADELTTEFARHVESFRTTRDETAAISDEIVSPAAAGRSFNAIIAEGLGKPLPTRSVGDEPSSSSYSSEDKTTTVVVLCTAAAAIFVAFSVAIYLITFQRQHGTLDIEMQEQRCGKDDLEDDEDAETRVTLLNQLPPVDSDEHSFD